LNETYRTPKHSGREKCASVEVFQNRYSLLFE